MVDVDEISLWVGSDYLSVHALQRLLITAREFPVRSPQRLISVSASFCDELNLKLLFGRIINVIFQGYYSKICILTRCSVAAFL